METCPHHLISYPVVFPKAALEVPSCGSALRDQPDVVHEHLIEREDHHRGCAMHGDRQAGTVEPGGDGDCGELVGYVDDGAYSYAHGDPAVLSQILTKKNNLMEDWINGNRLVINPDKTHLMVMGPKKISEKRKQVSIQAGHYTITN
jgi:hypothetical protein